MDTPLSMAHSRYSVTLFMRSPTMLNDCGGPSSARGAGGDTTAAAASTSPTPTALRHRPSGPVGLTHEVACHLEERHVGHDVPRAEVDRGKKAHHRGPDQEHGGGHEQ